MTATDLNTVRDALNRFANPITDEALAALDRIETELSETQTLSYEHYEAYRDEVGLRKAAEAERDRWRAVACNVKDGTQAAEARVTELEAALTKIADGTILSTRFREIAAAALAKEDTDE